MYLSSSQICAAEPNDNDESCKEMQCSLAVLHYLQLCFEMKCHNSRYYWVTYQLLDSSERVGLMDSFNSARKNRRWAISNRTSKEGEMQDEEAVPVHGEPPTQLEQLGCLSSAHRMSLSQPTSSPDFMDHKRSSSVVNGDLQVNPIPCAVLGCTGQLLLFSIRKLPCCWSV